MGRIYGSVEELIGGTPLLEVRNIERKEGLNGRLLVKLEYLNPAGSAKDRVARCLIAEAEKRGELLPGGTIIEPTSGNTGLGLAAVGVPKGYRVIIVMPDSMSEERKLLMKAYGAELLLSPGAEGMKGAIALAAKLQAEIPGSFIPGQFDNPDNAKAHYETTGPEIFRDTDGELDYFVAGIGTGGTITGTGRYLKERKPELRVLGVEPFHSAVLSGGSAGKHNLQGIGAGFVPGVLDTGIYDEILPVKDEEAYRAGRLLARTEGILCGITSGAALHAGMELLRRPENAGKTVVVLLPDTGDRYLSTPLYKD